jgi:uncharacterized protein YndB with AHSA1/START domain
MTATTEGREVRAEMKTTATPEQVWDAWTKGDLLSGWFTDRAELDPRPGGTLKWFFDKFGLELPGTFVDVEPQRLISWTWPRQPGHPPGMLVITIEREGGVTHMTLANSGFTTAAEWDDEYEGVRSGWQLALGILRVYLERYFGRTKDVALVLRPARYDYDRIAPYFSDATRLAEWLTTSGTIGQEGDPVRLTFRDGSTLTGRVIARSAREVAVTWDEMDGILELKAFRAGPGARMLGVRASGWDWPGGRAAQLEAKLTPWVERLAILQG